MNNLERITGTVEVGQLKWYERDEVKYLLSIIEQAEKALEILANDTNWSGATLYDESRNSGIIEWSTTGSPFLIAQKALQAIRGKTVEYDLSGYIGIFKNERSYDPRTVKHLKEQVSAMKKEHVREMVENSKIGIQMLHPEYLQILLNRLEESK